MLFQHRSLVAGQQGGARLAGAAAGRGGAGALPVWRWGGGRRRRRPCRCNPAERLGTGSAGEPAPAAPSLELQDGAEPAGGGNGAPPAAATDGSLPSSSSGGAAQQAAEPQQPTAWDLSGLLRRPEVREMLQFAGPALGEAPCHAAPLCLRLQPSPALAGRRVPPWHWQNGPEPDGCGSDFAVPRRRQPPPTGLTLADPLMSLIDTACVGQVSAVQLAALGPNTFIFNFVFQVRF